MTHRFNVVIIGAGPAGVAAAGALAGTGISVALLEAGVYAGAENWSGCVYFSESLAAPDCFGPDAVAAAPFERRVVRRGTLMHNGLDAIGLELDDRDAFRDCYTVLRPIYDPYFAGLARSKGAVHLAGTTVTSLIRKNGRVIGAETNRGPLFADVIFLAEGDASHLVRSERLERVEHPHFLQGVKAVLSLPAGEIEKRFRLAPGEGAAYELLLRNPVIGGRTAKLNIGGFLYTNRDSISIGYVAPLENIRENFRGSHDRVYEWMCGLSYIRELIEGATLSAYGTKLIRSGGPLEQPILVQDGFAVGGAATGLGVDIPFPNFTGPASASGLLFARAVRNILKNSGSFDARVLAREYAAPLAESTYGGNAQYLSRWPSYFGRSRVLFGRTVDLACGSARFLATGSIVETARFLRTHFLSFRALRELIMDTARALGSLRLWDPLLRTVFSPATLWQWTANSFRRTRASDQKTGIILYLDGKRISPDILPWPLNALLASLSPHLRFALEQVYANDGRPLKEKFDRALRQVLRGLDLGDLVLLPLCAAVLFLLALGTAAVDAFRFYLLKTPVTKLLAEPVATYSLQLKKARDLDLIRPSLALETKLATNTYRVGRESHIKTVWPGQVQDQPSMAQAGLWWVCPARVYVYDAPQFSGRGKITVNYENCIKCESCWRAEPLRTLWGRHTGHGLIYRPESSALSVLLGSLKTVPAAPNREGKQIGTAVPKGDVRLRPEAQDAADAVINTCRTFRDSVQRLPVSADKARMEWPTSLGKRLVQELSRLADELAKDGSPEQAAQAGAEREAFAQRLTEGRLFHALYCSNRIEERLTSATTGTASPGRWIGTGQAPRIPHPAVSALFPDRIVKQWEETPIPEEWCRRLRAFIFEHRDKPGGAVRALSSVSPALGLIAARQLPALGLSEGAAEGICAVDGGGLTLHTTAEQRTRITGQLRLVPLAASDGLLICFANKGFIVPLDTPGISVKPTPAIGFRAAGLAEVALDCVVTGQAIIIEQPGEGLLYLSLALGAADYLVDRVTQHADSRVQFAGQMLDTEGRDGIAKLGAVKALIARTAAWRLVLLCLYDRAAWAPFQDAPEEVSLVLAALAAKAFGPEPGSMGYDAGQVFGGFAYSEDDLLSRTYRDSSLFRFLHPGHGAAARLHGLLKGRNLEHVLASSLDRIGEEPLGRLVSRFRTLVQECSELPPETDATLSGEAEAILIGIQALLVSTEQALQQGQSREAEAAACEVLLSLADDALRKAALSSGRGLVSPSAVFPLEPPAGTRSGGTDYEAFCAGPGDRHRSGSFLLTAFDRSARFVPEMQMDDQRLRERWQELAGWFKTNCRDKLFDGLDIERFIEKDHRLPGALIQAAKDHRWLATYIPSSLDGLGWRKAEYYILNAAAGSFGDASIDLLIMASTSIGTTPILLGLEEELPRVQEELTPLVEDDQKLGQIQISLERITNSFSSPNPAWIKKEYEAVMKLVDERIRHTRVVKYLGAKFLKTFYGAGLAGRRADLSGFMQGLNQARELFTRLMPDVRAALEELPRRARCHTLFLRALGHGGVSAFALTEPTAGSDSGGVKTSAGLSQSELTALEDGRYSFSIGGNALEVRYLIDADRITFDKQGMAYETPDGTRRLIRYDRYDYPSDQGTRYYIHNGKECPFHDIGQVRRTPGGNLYEYYTLTGAKMWITNGSIATQFCLYAQTTEGVTGFLVDRHAEGLKVGADEKKTGQRGSPTNEISIDSVRVPREAVIGYEGHGQVNALETLNVGRCGLAVVSGALMRKLMREANDVLPVSQERDALLGEAAAVLFASESLAYYLVGLFDRPHESVRMESAIAKYACSEDIHESITLLEQAFGPVGQTERFLLEKARRDSRILTIYEGTNEVQRFLILKDLIGQAAAWPEVPEQQAAEVDRTLATWKNRLRKQVVEVRELLGDTSWSDAMLQPALFPLSEMAGEILRLECIYYRMEWLDARRSDLDMQIAGYGGTMRAAGERAIARTLARLEHLYNKARAGWQHIRSGMDMPDVRLGDAVLDEAARKEEAAIPRPGPALGAALRILCIVRPVADLSPRPRLIDGQLQELVWKIDPSDNAALTQALELRSRGQGRVIVDVLMPGGAEHDQLLRMTAGTRADNLHRLPVAPEASPDEYIQGIKNLEVMQQYQLIMTGAACRNGDQGLGGFIAGRLKRYHYRRERLEVKPDGSGLVHLAVPAAVSITQSGDEPVLTMAECVDAQYSPVKLMKTSGKSSARAAGFALPFAAPSRSLLVTTPAEAAAFLTTFAASAAGGQAEEHTAELRTGPVSRGNAVWAVLEPHDQKQNLAVLRASALAAEALDMHAQAIVAAPRDRWPRLLGVARAQGCSQAFCLDTGTGRLSRDGRRSLLRLIMNTAENAMLFAPLQWTGSLSYLAGEAGAQENILCCSAVAGIETENTGTITFSQPCYDGRLLRRNVYHGGRALVSIAPEGEFAAAHAKRDFTALALDIQVNPDWIMPLPPAAPPTLSQADVIIDLGYGVRDSSGLVLARELKDKLEALGLAPLFGATRKVTQDLKLLPLDAQIGQTGVRVNPKLILALGISGAPQHIDYLGTRAEILCFNKDNEAPLMKLNRERPAPRVHPIPGDLFVTVRALLDSLD